MRNGKKILILFLVLLLVAAGVVAGWHYGRHASEHAAEKGGATAGKVEYTCSMHPFIVKDSPGTCPICGMELIKKLEGAPSGGGAAGPGELVLSPSQQVMANVATVAAELKPLTREVAAVGIVQFDQSRQSKVTSWIAGRIDNLYVNKVGDFVSAGRPVAAVYSPDLVAAQQEYLLALRSRATFKDSPIQSIALGGESLVASARQRLKLLGVRDEQIAALEKNGSTDMRLNIYTPISGVVIEKMVQQGQYVNTGDPLFSVADLSSVWVELEVYENEFPYVKIGQRVDIVSQSYPGKIFGGTVSYIYPFLDPKTRTVKARVTLPNPGTRLKPDMFVNATVKASLGKVLVVPVTALIDTGKRQVVWVEKESGRFEPRDVQVGARVGQEVQILSGVKAGEKVAASGGYLIDSESQLSGAPDADHSQHGAKKPVAASPAAPSPPGKQSDMDMSDMKMQ